MEKELSPKNNSTATSTSHQLSKEEIERDADIGAQEMCDALNSAKKD